MTGAGGMFAEGAGSGELINEALCRVALAWGKRGPATRLTQAFIQQAGAKNIDDLLEGLVMERYRVDGRAAPLVFQAAREGDMVAREVIEWAGGELASLANGVIRQLNFEAIAFDVIMVGSMFNGGSLLINPMRAAVLEVAPKARLVQLTVPPVVGAVLLGMEQVDAPILTARINLAKSLHQLWPGAAIP